MVWKPVNTITAQENSSRRRLDARFIAGGGQSVWVGRESPNSSPKSLLAFDEWKDEKMETRKMSLKRLSGGKKQEIIFVCDSIAESQIDF